MTCVGTTIYKKRCRWDIPYGRFLHVRRMLDDFETKAPEKATGSLKRLARLCLCEEYHQNQSFEVINKWEDAIEEATKFYEKGQDLKERNRELMRALKEEITKRVVLEGKFEAETSRRKQEVKSIGAMSQEVSLLRTKLKEAETEVRNSKEDAQKLGKAYDECVVDTAERIATLQAAWNDGNQRIATKLEKERETAIRAIRLELGKVEAKEKSLVEQVSQLTRRLDNTLIGNSTLRSELSQLKSDRDLALSQKDELKSRLEIAAEQIALLGISLQEAETARDMFAEESQRLQAQLKMEGQKLKAISDAKAELGGTNTGLVQEVGTLSAQLSSEHHNSAKLRLSLQMATDDLSRAQKQQETVNEDLYRNKEELAKLQVEFAKGREDTEKEHRRLSLQQETSLARIDHLMQEIAYAKNHPIRIFLVNLLEVTAGWAKAVIVCFGNMRTRKMFDRATMHENMPSP